MEEKIVKEAILVGVNVNNNPHFQMEMEELEGLANAIGITVLDKVVQSADSINPKTYVRSGKLEEIKNLIDVHEVDYVIFNDELSGAIISNLSKSLDAIIYDRTYLILEIFKERASTREAKLQVDIASLIYMKSRLVGLREGLSRQRGGASSGGAYGKGRGETQLEIDRRNIADRIVYLRHELSDCVKQRQIQRKKRDNSGLPVVALVGYTNAGKSSMINKFMSYSSNPSKEVWEKDMLFATLETSSRLINLANNHSFILTDTVGFISKLPTTLVEAFKSTLEEICDADLLIHVVDSSNSDFEIQIETTNSVLKEIGVDGVDSIYAFNKSDLTQNPIIIPKNVKEYVITSVKESDGIDELINRVEKHLFGDEVNVELYIPYEDSKVISFLKENANVISLKKTDTGIDVHVIISSENFKRVSKYKK